MTGNQSQLLSAIQKVEQKEQLKPSKPLPLPSPPPPQTKNRKETTKYKNTINEALYVQAKMKTKKTQPTN